jgi:cytoskeletal protein CcmA (bactofilin family)
LRREVNPAARFVKSFPKNGIASPLESCCTPANIMANATNVLTQGIEITGSIRFSNDMIIDGKIDGEIISDKGKVTIAENANIKGDVKAGEVKLYGKVEGTITSGRCELKEKSFLKGDIKTKTLSMEEGATLQGSTQIGG